MVEFGFLLIGIGIVTLLDSWRHVPRLSVLHTAFYLLWTFVWWLLAVLMLLVVQRYGAGWSVGMAVWLNSAVCCLSWGIASTLILVFYSLGPVSTSIRELALTGSAVSAVLYVATIFRLTRGGPPSATLDALSILLSVVWLGGVTWKYAKSIPGQSAQNHVRT